MRHSDLGGGWPRLFELPAKWGELKEQFVGLGGSRQLEWIYEHVSGEGTTAALLEHEYLDRDYRDEYRQFYSQTFRQVPDRCARLHFWADDRYLGYCSLRPIVGRPVGRTMLDPGAIADDVSCVVRASASPYGEALEVPAFPFISQDRQYGRCAHAVIWMIAQYHHLRYGTPERFMSDIVSAARDEEFERIVPSKGLTDDQVGAALRNLDLAALRYQIGKEGLDEEDLIDTVRRYLNSGMPIALGTPGHLTALIGAGYDDDGKLTVVQCDDERGPYVTKPIELTGRHMWEVLFVPLPGRIYVPYEEIDKLVFDQLEALVYEYGVDEVLASHKLRYREYVVEVREYKRALAGRGLPGQAAQAHAVAPSARWLWVLEVQDAELAKKSPKCVLGEITIDATSDAEDLVFVAANLPGLRASWPQEQDDLPIVRPNAGLQPYLTGTALNI